MLRLERFMVGKRGLAMALVGACIWSAWTGMVLGCAWLGTELVVKMHSRNERGKGQHNGNSG